jgi:tetratricopeptide (TPR) repeat protein
MGSCRYAVLVYCFLLPYGLGLTGCAAKLKLAVAGSLIQDVAEAAARHDDIVLATQAVPSYLLLLEGLLASNPDNQRLLIATAQTYTAYGTLIELEEPERARSLYQRAKECGLKALGQKKRIGPLLNAPYDEFTGILTHLETDDVPLAFWAASSWGSWISASTESMSALAELPKVIFLMEWVLQEDETFQFGAPHLFLGIYHAALPPALGGDPEQALSHFERAIEISQGQDLMAQVLMARYYARQIFDRELYETLLTQVLDLPARTVPELNLQNAAAKRQARRLLEEADDFF